MRIKYGNGVFQLRHYRERSWLKSCPIGQPLHYLDNGLEVPFRILAVLAAHQLDGRVYDLVCHVVIGDVVVKEAILTCDLV